MKIRFSALAWLVFAMFAYPTIAHDGSDHGNPLESWVSGIGILMIILLTIYQLWWKQRDIDFNHQDDVDLFRDES